MNPDLKARWIAALRSGQYRQCRRRLRTTLTQVEDVDGVPRVVIDGTAYCVIGVLLQVMGAHDRDYNDPTACLIAAGLPLAMAEQLILLNDDARLPFPALADQLELTLPENTACLN